MAVYGLWYGGASYAPPDDDEVEQFASQEVARQALEERRARPGTRHRFAYVRKPAESVRTPVVGDDSEILLFPSASDLSYPSWRLCFGADGEVRTEEC